MVHSGLVHRGRKFGLRTNAVGSVIGRGGNNVGIGRRTGGELFWAEH